MIVEITPTLLGGSITAVSSKSDAHRLLIACALADKSTTVKLNAFSDDINATITCLKALGAEFEINDSSVTVYPVKSVKSAVLDCAESGSTLRFLMPVASALCGNTQFCGRGRLPERPVDELRREMSKNGCEFSPVEEFPIKINGKLKSGEFKISGSVSSQFITGLLFALPLVEGNSKIELTSPLQSKAYVDMTLATLNKFGIKILQTENCFYINGSQRYLSPGVVCADGDWSNAAFWLCSGAIGHPVTVTNLDTESLQGDKKIIDILREMGANVICNEKTVSVSSSGKLFPVNVNAEQIPDLVPIVAVTALFASGKTLIYNAERLRIKESDRLASVCSIITSLGGVIREGKDFLEISGNNALMGGTVSSFNDHRIAMSAAICAERCMSNVTISGAQCTNKSYPAFFEDYKRLGGNINVICDR